MAGEYDWLKKQEAAKFWACLCGAWTHEKFPQCWKCGKARP